MKGPIYISRPGKPTSYGGPTVKVITICRECGADHGKPCAYLACPNRKRA